MKQSNFLRTLQILLDGLTFKDRQEQSRHQILEFVRTMSLNESRECLIEALQQVAEHLKRMAKSSDKSAHLALTLLISDLVEVRHEEVEKMFQLFIYQIMFVISKQRSGAVADSYIQPDYNSRTTILETAAFVLGKIAKVCDVSIKSVSASLESCINTGINWLREVSPGETKRLAAVLVLGNIAECAPTAFNVHADLFFEFIFNSLIDERELIRTVSATALRHALRVISNRDQDHKNRLYNRIFSQARREFPPKDKADEESPGVLLEVFKPKFLRKFWGKTSFMKMTEDSKLSRAGDRAKPFRYGKHHKIHGALLSIFEMVGECTGKFIENRFDDIVGFLFKAEIRFHLHASICECMMLTLPRLAKHAPSPEILTYFLEISIEHVLNFADPNFTEKKTASEVDNQNFNFDESVKPSIMNSASNFLKLESDIVSLEEKDSCVIDGYSSVKSVKSDGDRKVIRLSRQRLYRRNIIRQAAMVALGGLSTTEISCNDVFSRYIGNVLRLIELGLKPSPKLPFCTSALDCLRIVMENHDLTEEHTPILRRLVPFIFEGGISESLVLTISVFVRRVPAVKHRIQERLLYELCYVLPVFANIAERKKLISDCINNVEILRESSAVQKQKPKKLENIKENIITQSGRLNVFISSSLEEVDGYSASLKGVETGSQDDWGRGRDTFLDIKDRLEKFIREKEPFMFLPQKNGLLDLGTIKDTRSILLGLYCVGTFDFGEDISIIPFLNILAIPHLDSSDIKISAMAVHACCNVIYKVLRTIELENASSDDFCVFAKPDASCRTKNSVDWSSDSEEMQILHFLMEKLLKTALNGSDIRVRQLILRRINSHFLPFLSENPMMRLLVRLTVNESNFELRSMAVDSVGKLLTISKGHGAPLAQQLLVQLMDGFSRSVDSQNQEESLVLLGVFVRSMETILVQPYILPIADVLMSKFHTICANTATPILATIGEVARVGKKGTFSSKVTEILELVTQILDDRSPTTFTKPLIALDTLAMLTINESIPVWPYLYFHELLGNILRLMVEPASWTLRKQAMFTFGIVGALDPWVYGNQRLLLSKNREGFFEDIQPYVKKVFLRHGRLPSFFTYSTAKDKGKSRELDQYNFKGILETRTHDDYKDDFGGCLDRSDGKSSNEKGVFSSLSSPPRIDSLAATLQLVNNAAQNFPSVAFLRKWSSGGISGLKPDRINPEKSRIPSADGLHKQKNVRCSSDYRTKASSTNFQADNYAIPVYRFGEGFSIGFTKTKLSPAALLACRIAYRQVRGSNGNETCSFDEYLEDLLKTRIPPFSRNDDSKYFARVAVIALGRVLATPSLEEHSETAMEVLNQTLRAYGPDCSCLLHVVIPVAIQSISCAKRKPLQCYASSMEACKCRCQIGALCTLLATIDVGVSLYVPAFIELCCELWDEDDENRKDDSLLLSVALVRVVAPQALRPYIGTFAGRLLKLLNSERNRLIFNRSYSILITFVDLAPSLGELLHLIVPTLTTIVSSTMVPMDLRIESITVLAFLGKSFSIGSFAGQIVHALVKALDDCCFIPAVMESNLGEKPINALRHAQKFRIIEQFDSFSKKKRLHTVALESAKSETRANRRLSATESNMYDEDTHPLSTEKLITFRVLSSTLRLLLTLVEQLKHEYAIYSPMIFNSLLTVADSFSNRNAPVNDDLVASYRRKAKKHMNQYLALVDQVMSGQFVGPGYNLEHADSRESVFRGLSRWFLDSPGSKVCYCNGRSVELGSYSGNIGDPDSPMDISSLKLSWHSAQISTEREWTEWMWRFVLQFIRQARNKSIQCCYQIAQSCEPFALEIFNAAFLSCWNSLDLDDRLQFVSKLELAMKSENMPQDVLKTLIHLAEFMEKCDPNALPIDLALLSEAALRCQAYAKALHYKELEFRTSPTNCVGDLITIYDNLELFDAATGVVYIGQALEDGIEIQPQWFERLQDWKNALSTYEAREKTLLRKSKGSKTNRYEKEIFEAVFGRLRCMNSLGKWTSVLDLIGDIWDGLLAIEVGFQNKPLERGEDVEKRAASDILKPMRQTISSAFRCLSLERDFALLRNYYASKSLSILYRCTPSTTRFVSSYSQKHSFTSRDLGDVGNGSTNVSVAKQNFVASAGASAQSVDEIVRTEIEKLSNYHKLHSIFAWRRQNSSSYLSFRDFSFTPSIVYQALSRSKKYLQIDFQRGAIYNGSKRYMKACRADLAKERANFYRQPEGNVNLDELSLSRKDVDDFLAQLASLGSKAAFALGEWDHLQQFSRRLRPKFVDDAISKIVGDLHSERLMDAQQHIDEAFALVNQELPFVTPETYRHVYPKMIEIQQITELQEILDYKRLLREETAEEASNYMLGLRKIWATRLRGVQASTTVLLRILGCRSLIINPMDSIEAWLKLAKVARKERHYNICIQILKKLGIGENKSEKPFENRITSNVLNSVGTHDLCGSCINSCKTHCTHQNACQQFFIFKEPLELVKRVNPLIVFSYLKYLWAVGSKIEAFDRLQRLRLIVLRELHSGCPSRLAESSSSEFNDPKRHLFFNMPNESVYLAEVEKIDVNACSIQQLWKLVVKCDRHLGSWLTDIHADEFQLLLSPVKAAMARQNSLHKGGLGILEKEINFKVFQSSGDDTKFDACRNESFPASSSGVSSDHHSGIIFKYVLRYYFEATQIDPESYKAWHAWALANYQAATASLSVKLEQNGSEQAPGVKNKGKTEESIHLCVVPAIRGFFRSISLRSLNRVDIFQDILRLVSLWFHHFDNKEVTEEIKKGTSNLDIECWLLVIPQLIARLKRPGDIVSSLLREIGTEHPQALIYPLLAARNSNDSHRSRAADAVLNHMRGSFPKFVEEALEISRELTRVAVLQQERWYYRLEEASYHYFSQEKNLSEMMLILESLNTDTRLPPETMHEISCIQKYQRALQEAFEWVEKHKNSQRKGEVTPYLDRAWYLYHEVFRRIKSQMKETKELQLRIVSRLFSFQLSELAIPGTYEVEKPAITIEDFDPTARVVHSKRRPRVIRMIGSDGVTRPFLLKGNEDLRMDERAMQLFAFLNGIIKRQRDISKLGLAIQRYAVVPLSGTSGIVEWVSNSDTLSQLIKEYREVNGIPIMIEGSLMNEIAPGYDSHTTMQKVEALEFALQQTTGRDLQRLFWLRSSSSELWVQHRTNYVRSLAVMSMVGHILGLGDRHPSNLMLERSSGRVVHIDFGDCFEVAMHRDQFPERVPFRLTRMLVNAMEASSIDGSFLHTSLNVMRVLRENHKSILTLLEAFVYDPLVSWRILLYTTQRQFDRVPNNAAECDSENTESPVLTWINESKSPSTNCVKTPKQVINPFLANPGRHGDVGAPMQSHCQRTLGTIKSCGVSFDLDGDVKLRRRAVEIMHRVHSKLTGRDFPNMEEPEKALSVEAQVHRLISQATSHENLAQHFHGWQPAC